MSMSTQKLAEISLIPSISEPPARPTEIVLPTVKTLNPLNIVKHDNMVISPHKKTKTKKIEQKFLLTKNILTIFFDKIFLYQKSFDQ